MLSRTTAATCDSALEDCSRPSSRPSITGLAQTNRTLPLVLGARMGWEALKPISGCGKFTPHNYRDDMFVEDMDVAIEWLAIAWEAEP